MGIQGKPVPAVSDRECATYRRHVSDDPIDAAGPEQVPAPSGVRAWLAGLSGAKAFWVYTGLRALIVLIVLGVGALLGFRGYALALVTVLVAGPVSLLVIGRLGSQASRSLTSAVHSLNDRLDASARVEDDDLDFTGIDSVVPPQAQDEGTSGEQQAQ